MRSDLLASFAFVTLEPAASTREQAGRRRRRGVLHRYLSARTYCYIAICYLLIAYLLLMQLKQAVDAAYQFFVQSDVPSPRLNAELLLMFEGVLLNLS